MNHKGENNPNWKGGRSKNNYYYSKRSKEKYPERNLARKKVFRAIKSGKLKRPDHCQFNRCLETEVFAHHHDYSRPLAVEWYCRKHHLEMDKKDNRKNESVCKTVLSN